MIKSDPSTLIKFVFTKDVILHTLSLNIAPDQSFKRAIENLSSNDALDIASSLLS